MSDDISPASMPFDRYHREHAPESSARSVLKSVAMAKRMLFQERVQGITAADVVALAALIEARDLQSGGK